MIVLEACLRINCLKKAVAIRSSRTCFGKGTNLGPVHFGGENWFGVDLAVIQHECAKISSHDTRPGHYCCIVEHVCATQSQTHMLWSTYLCIRYQIPTKIIHAYYFFDLYMLLFIERNDCCVMNVEVRVQSG